MELCKVFLATVAFITVQGQLSIDKTSIEDGGTYTMTCEASRLSTQNVNYISALTLDRISGAVITNIATYTPFPPPDLKNTSENAGGRRWNFQFIGGVGTTTPSNNKATIKIILVVSDGLCSDAGTYKCSASFASATAEDRKNITAQAKIEDPKIVSSHHIGNDLDYSSNELGENITLTCSVLGPPNLNLSWSYGPRGGFNFDVYPITNDIRETSGPSGGSCNQYRHESALNLMVQTNDIMYICVVKVNNQQEVGRANFTIGIQTTTTSPDTGAATEPAEANVGAIVGGVIGGLVLIAIIVIVVYFCWYRKRNDDDDSERDKEISATDNTHAPPPVFYAEPKKVKKDERDGVRPDKGIANEALDNSYDDSKDHRGPPQYINTVDGEDLPRYEKETHRGRSNRGYDDDENEKNEKNEGHGRRHRRDRKDKEDRDDRKPPRKDYDDRDKGRHYSTDDGTDNRDPQMGYGDPNMGTSI